MLCFCTVNNMALFNNMMYGALASRFPNKLYCPRPSLHIMEKILLREVKKVNGKEEWIAPTLEYCDVNKIDDPEML